jgi:hypothetical protein
MITTGEGIPTHSYVQNDVYYNRKTKDSNTQALRNFHNLYVKRKLIVGVSNAGDKLIDFACGKGGDLSKWRAAKLKFVLGVDVSRDNIQKQIDGACSRYLSDCRRYGEVNMPRCLFFTGDSGKNIRTTGDAFANPNEREYVKAVFGQGAKNPQELPPGVFKAFGWGEGGFDVGSVQFAIHYFFENETVLRQFLRNVSDCIHVGGYFIGTTYDGQTVFDKLRNKQKGESWTLMKNDTKIAEIVKQYSETEFPSDEHSIGYQINVYQETINQYFPEYLVNFKYLTYLMEQYGFQLVSPEEANHLGLPGSTGMFEELYNKMNYEIRKQYIESSEYGNAAEMSPDEMKISFLNRYFVFKKKHTVNTENLAKIIQSRASIASTQEKVEEEAMVYKTGEVSKTTVIRTKKLKNKLTIACPSSVSETTEPVPETLGEATAPTAVGKLTKVRVPKKYI